MSSETRRPARPPRGAVHPLGAREGGDQAMTHQTEGAKSMTTLTELNRKHSTSRADAPVKGSAWSRTTPTPGAPLPVYGTARPGSIWPSVRAR